MNIANLLSVIHLVLLPFTIYLIVQEIPFFNMLAIAILLFSVLTDLTGKIVGKKKISASFLHPFSDKIVVLTLLLVFVFQDIFSWFMFAVFLLRDILITIIRINASRDDVVIRGELYGKTITAFQFVLVFMILGREIFLPL